MTFNKFKDGCPELVTSPGKPVKTLSNLLREYNLPPGLFPRNITCGMNLMLRKQSWLYTCPLPVKLAFKDSSVLRYATRVKCTLLRGKLTGIDGMKTRVLVWVKVTNVTIEGYKSDKVWFTVGMKKMKV